jgi:hypothetical protein
MLNTCVKNVYAVCTTSGKFGHLHTPAHTTRARHVHNRATYTPTHTHGRYALVHIAQEWLPSVFCQLYPLSTRPIISKVN